MLIYTLVSLTVSFTHDIFFYSYNSIYIIFVILLLFDIYMPSSSLHMYSERPHSNLISPTCKCHVYSDHLPKLINIFFCRRDWMHTISNLYHKAVLRRNTAASYSVFGFMHDERDGKRRWRHPEVPSGDAANPRPNSLPSRSLASTGAPSPRGLNMSKEHSCAPSGLSV